MFSRGERGAKGHFSRCSGREERGMVVEGQPSGVWGQAIGKEEQVSL